MQPEIKCFLTQKGDPRYTPFKKHATDAGFDLFAAGLPNDFPSYMVMPGKLVLIDVGYGFEIPDGWYGEIHGRSSMNAKAIICTGGVIDAPYRGTVKVALINLSGSSYQIQLGDRIAQIVFKPCYVGSLQVIERDDITVTERGANGFGSTGK